MVITRPPEIIACFCIAHPDGVIYVIFDSHPRPDLHPDSAAFIFNKSADAAATYLANLLHYDSSLLADRNLQWETQLLGNFSGHLFVAPEAHPLQEDADYWANATMEASLEGLALKADNMQLKSENDSLKAELSRLRDPLVMVQEQRAQTFWRAAAHPKGARPSKRDSLVSTLVQQGSSALAAARSYAYSLKQPSSQPQPGSSANSTSSASTSEPDIPLVAKAPPTKADSRSRNGKARALDDTYTDTANDLAFALAQQRLYDEEHRALEKEREKILLPQPFTCNICLDDHSHEDVAQVDGCGHLFCRDCIRSHVSTQLAQHLYPIVCPVCSAQKIEKGPTGELASFFSVHAVLTPQNPR